MSHEYTEEEMVDKLMRAFASSVDYWEHTDRTTRRKLEGLLHSILATLDGCSEGIPAMILVPVPHESDKEYAQEEGRNWWPCNHENLRGVVGIDTMLHETIYNRGYLK